MGYDGDFDYNLNCFKSELLCHSYCGGELTELDDVEDICSLDQASVYTSDNKNGNLNVHRYFYNKTTQKCESFQLGGIGANLNNFITLKTCQLICEQF